MKNLLTAIILATLATATLADPRPRRIQMMCGSLEDVQLTMEKYGETLVLASLAPDQKTSNLLFVNFETQTSSWFIQDIELDEFCMAGVGGDIHIPKDSPLNLGTGLGKKVHHRPQKKPPPPSTKQEKELE